MLNETSRNRGLRPQAPGLAGTCWQDSCTHRGPSAALPPIQRQDARSHHQLRVPPQAHKKLSWDQLALRQAQQVLVWTLRAAASLAPAHPSKAPPSPSTAVQLSLVGGGGANHTHWGSASSTGLSTGLTNEHSCTCRQAPRRPLLRSVLSVTPLPLDYWSVSVRVQCCQEVT